MKLHILASAILLVGVVLASEPLDNTLPASDELWASCMCKGAKGLTQMSYSDYDVGQSLPVPQPSAQSPWGFGKKSRSSVTS